MELSRCGTACFNAGPRAQAGEKHEDPPPEPPPDKLPVEDRPGDRHVANLEQRRAHSAGEFGIGGDAGFSGLGFGVGVGVQPQQFGSQKHILMSPAICSPVFSGGGPARSRPAPTCRLSMR